jgi:magnesium-transporting ATPase (P-type)
VIYRVNATLELLLFLVLAATILEFKLTGIQIVFLVLVNDVTVMLIAIDKVPLRMQPQRWNIKYLSSISIFMGLFSIAIVMTTLVVLKHYYGFPNDVVSTAMFLQLSITDQLTILSTRTRGMFFLSMPHWLLLSACVLTQVLFTLFALYGVAMPATYGYLVGIIWGVSMGSLIIKDFAKIVVMFILDAIMKEKHATCVEISCAGFPWSKEDDDELLPVGDAAADAAAAPIAPSAAAAPAPPAVVVQ